MHFYDQNMWRARGWGLDAAGKVIAVVCRRGSLEQTVPVDAFLGDKIRYELLHGVEVDVVIERDRFTCARVKKLRELEPEPPSLFERLREMFQ